MEVKHLRCDICGEDYEQETPSEVPFAYEPKPLRLPYYKSEGVCSEKDFRDVCYSCQFKIAKYLHDVLGYDYIDDSQTVNQ